VDGECFCEPGVYGDSGPGQPCPFDQINVAASLCQAGLTCLGLDNDPATATPCPGGDPTECGRDFQVYNPVCLAGYCGGSFCAPRCDGSGACAAGFDPYDIDAECFCIPVPVGNAVAGEPCPFGSVNAAADFCAAGLSCLGISPAETTNACPSGVSQCTDMQTSWNPDCVDLNGTMRCAASFCAARCQLGVCTLAGFSPQMIGSICYCIPD
jgi:hypothetical protein